MQRRSENVNVITLLFTAYVTWRGDLWFAVEAKINKVRLRGELGNIERNTVVKATSKNAAQWRSSIFDGSGSRFCILRNHQATKIMELQISNSRMSIA